MVSALTLINTYSTFYKSTHSIIQWRAVDCVAGCQRHDIYIWNYKTR